MSNTSVSSASESASPAQVLRRFRVVFNAVRTHFREMEKQAGLGGAQVWALNLIRQQPGMGMGGIAQDMDIHQSTASNLIKTLLSKELVRLEKAPEDRRNVRLYIQPEGERILEKVSGPFEGVLPDALSRLPASTLLRLDTDLADLIALLQADERAATTPLAEL